MSFRKGDFVKVSGDDKDCYYHVQQKYHNGEPVIQSNYHIDNVLANEIFIVVRVRAIFNTHSIRIEKCSELLRKKNGQIVFIKREYLEAIK
jgi:hypothetical protein